MTIPATTASITPGTEIPWATLGVVAGAAIAALATMVAAVIAYRSTRTATAMTTQSSTQTATMTSVDRHLELYIENLQAEVLRRQEREDALAQRLSGLEATFSAYRDQTDAKIRDLTSEVHQLRSSDTAWKRWASTVISLYADAAELLRQRGEQIPVLPPSPPLTDVI